MCGCANVQMCELEKETSTNKQIPHAPKTNIGMIGFHSRTLAHLPAKAGHIF